MSEHYPRIRIRWKQFPELLAVSEALFICFYMRRPHRELGPSVLRALEVYRQAVGPQGLAWYADDREDWSELDERGWERTRQDLLAPDSALVYLLQTPDCGTHQFQFDYQGRWPDQPDALIPPRPEETSVASFWLPTEYLEEHGPARVHALALALARELPFDSGHAGLAFHYAQGLHILDAIRELCFRYPGLDIPDPGMDSMYLGTQVQGVHWVNFLGPPVLGELGGVQALSARLSCPGTIVEPLGAERAVVTLGPWPQAGDTQQGLTLPAWRELARVLEPHLHGRRHAFHDFSAEEMRRWERRFLD